MKQSSLLLALLFVADFGYAQNWGTGQWGGMQNCGYPVSAAPGASNVSDEMKELQQNLAQSKKDLSTKKSEKKKVERELEKARRDITDTVQSGYADFAINHIEGGQTCESYKPTARRPLKTSPFEAEEWSSICLPGAGSVSSELCTEYREADAKGNSSVCAKALPTYKKKFAEAKTIEREIENLQRAIERANDDIKEARNNKTEGGICIECMQKNNGYQAQPQQPQTNWVGVAANVGMGLASMYAGYQTNKTVAQYNSNLGFATQPVSSFGYGYPYFQNAMYGAMGGGMGQGGFGCGSSMAGGGNMNGAMGMMGPYGSASLYGGMGGAFGYPSSMMGMQQMGGGMYNTGLGSWGGMAGPWGNTSGLSSMYGMNSMYGTNSMYGYGNSNSLAMMQMQLQMNSLMSRLPYTGYYGTGTYGTGNTYSSSGSITTGASSYGYGVTYPYSSYPYATTTYSPYSYYPYSYYPTTTATTTLTTGR